MNKPVFAIAGVVLAAAVYAATKPVTVELHDAKGGSVGTATLSEAKDEMCIRDRYQGCPEFWVHLAQRLFNQLLRFVIGHRFKR